MKYLFVSENVCMKYFQISKTVEIGIVKLENTECLF